MARGYEGMHPLYRKLVTDAIKTNYIIESGLTGNIAITNVLNSNGLSDNISSAFEKTTNKKGTLILDLSKFKRTIYRKNKETGEKTKEVIVESIKEEDIDFAIKLIDRLYKEFNDFDKLEHFDILVPEIKKYLDKKGVLEMSELVEIGIDLGNENVKVNYKGNIFQFENKVGRVNNEEECKQNDYIKFDDEVQYFTIADTEESFDNSLYKDEREGNLKVIYYSIVRAFKEFEEKVPDEIQTKIKILTPINQMNRAEIYKNNILAKKSALTTVRIGNEVFINQIELVDVEVIAEGISSLNVLKERTDVNLAKEQVALLDMGSKTVNAVKVLKAAKLVDYKTYDNEGLNDIYYNQLCQKYNFTLDQIKVQIDIGQAKHDKKLLFKYFLDIYKKVQRDMKFNTCNHIIFTGGTIELMKQKGMTEELMREKLKTDKIVFLENSTYSNVLGLS